MFDSGLVATINAFGTNAEKMDAYAMQLVAGLVDYLTIVGPSAIYTLNPVAISALLTIFQSPRVVVINGQRFVPVASSAPSFVFVPNIGANTNVPIAGSSDYNAHLLEVGLVEFITFWKRVERAVARLGVSFNPADLEFLVHPQITRELPEIQPIFAAVVAVAGTTANTPVPWWQDTGPMPSWLTDLIGLHPKPILPTGGGVTSSGGGTGIPSQGGGHSAPDPDASNGSSGGGSQSPVADDSSQPSTTTQGQTPITQPNPQTHGVDDARLGGRPIGKASVRVQQILGYSDDDGGATPILRGGGISMAKSDGTGTRPDPESTGGSSGGGGGDGGGDGYSFDKGSTFNAGLGASGRGGNGAGGSSTGKGSSGSGGRGSSGDSSDGAGDGDPPPPPPDRRQSGPDPETSGPQPSKTGMPSDDGMSDEGPPQRPNGRGRPRPPSFQDPNRGLSRAKLRMLLAMARESGYQSGDDWGAGGYNPRFSSGSNADPETTGSRRGADPWSGGGGSSDSGGPDFFSGGGTPTTSQWSYGPPLWSDSDDYWSDYNPHYRPFGNTSWAQAPTATTTSTPVNLQSRLRALSPTALIRLK